VISLFYDRWLSLRDRLIANPGFQRWAADFPLFRWVAQRRARQLFDLVAGFVYTQILLACVRVDLFNILAEGPQSEAALAPRLKLPPEGTRRLLLAAVALGLAEKRRGGTFGLGQLGAAMVGNPGVAALVEHHALVYPDLHDPLALLRGERSDTGTGGYWPYAAYKNPAGVAAERVADYSSLMSITQPLVAEDVLDAYPVANHKKLLDVGGGEGTFARAVATRVPGIELMVFDLPPVAERARARFVEVGLNDRAQAFGGDFFRDPLPSGADLVSLVRVVHDHDDDKVEQLFASIRKVLPRTGALLIAEQMSDTPGAEPIGDAYFGFYLMAMGRGRPRSPAELTRMLHGAGFSAVRSVRTRRPMLASLLVAQP